MVANEVGVLKNKINDWVHGYKETYGRNPTPHDIKGCPEIVSVYKKYKMMESAAMREHDRVQGNTVMKNIDLKEEVTTNAWGIAIDPNGNEISTSLINKNEINQFIHASPVEWLMHVKARIEASPQQLYSNEKNTAKNINAPNIHQLEISNKLHPLIVPLIKHQDINSTIIQNQYTVDIVGPTLAHTISNIDTTNEELERLKRTNAVFQEDDTLADYDVSLNNEKVVKKQPRIGVNKVSNNYIKTNLKKKGFCIATQKKTPAQIYKSKLKSESKHLFSEYGNDSDEKDEVTTRPSINPDLWKDELLMTGDGIIHESRVSELSFNNPSIDDITESAADNYFNKTTVEPSFSMNNSFNINHSSDNKNAELNIDLDKINLNEELKKVYSFDTFRPGQKDVINRVLRGLTTLLVQPTGSGKSITYQLPIYIANQQQAAASTRILNPTINSPHNTDSDMKRNYIALVIFPLLSLMWDQLKKLPISIKAVCLTSEQTETEKNALVKKISAGNYDLVFVSPELVISKKFYNWVYHAKHPFPKILYVCIDEAHCVSEWSHNFRPSYLRIGSVLRESYHVPCVLALTATVTLESLSCIASLFDIPNNGVIRGIDIPINIDISFSNSDDIDKEKDLIQLLSYKTMLFGVNETGSINSPSVPIIIYCSKQYQTQQLSYYLKKNGYSAVYYHAGMATEDRMKAQSLFMCDKVSIIVATIAFGMGINKPNVRGVIHYNMPKSIENFVQEIGRAGRDGKDSFAHCYYSSTDLAWQRSRSYSYTIEKKQLVKFLSKFLTTEAINQPLEIESKQKKSNFKLLSIERTISELDIEEQTLMTIMCKLEQAPLSLIVIETTMESLGKLTASKSVLDEIAANDPLLAPLLSDLYQYSNADEYTCHYIIDICEFSSLYNYCALTLYNNLKRLGSKRDVKLNLSAKAWCYSIKKPLKTAQFAFLCKKMMDIMETIVYKNWLKVNQMAHLAILTIEASRPPHNTHKNTLNSHIRRHVKQYFLMDFSTVTSTTSLSTIITNNKPKLLDDSIFNCKTLSIPTPLDERSEDNLRIRIRAILQSHRNQITSPLVFSKMLHGIPTPQYSLQQWNQYSFIGTFISYEFSIIYKLVSELINEVG